MDFTPSACSAAQGSLTLLHLCSKRAFSFSFLFRPSLSYQGRKWRFFLFFFPFNHLQMYQVTSSCQEKASQVLLAGSGINSTPPLLQTTKDRQPRQTVLINRLQFQTNNSLLIMQKRDRKSVSGGESLLQTPGPKCRSGSAKAETHRNR